MNRLNACLRMAAAVLFIGALGGCNGILNLGEGGVGRVCQSSVECDDGDLCIGGTCQYGNENRCWIYNPTGTCPSGSHCVDGVCTRTSIPNWCACEPQDGCYNGQCVDISEDTECSADRQNGACLSGSVCVAGTCVEITPGNICSANRLNGLCPSGAACVRGQCMPIAEDPCGPTNTDGLCPSGSRCNSAGTCELVPCSSAAPNGACVELGTVCQNGMCVAVPCSPENPAGPCSESGTFCSVDGECIPSGTCSADGDCSEGTYCAVAGVCRPVGTCVDPGDCGLYSTCNGGTCVRDLSCTDDANCPSGEHCLNYPGGGQCQPLYKCYDDTDCGTDAYCSAVGECVASGQCLNAADCGPTTCNSGTCTCSSVNTCINAGGCAVSADCGIGQRCNLGSCVAVDACSANWLPNDTCSSANVNDCCTSHSSVCSGNICIPVGRCRTSSDCAPGVTCDLTDNTCSVGTACSPSSPCPTGQYCTAYNVCATGDANDECSTALDCTGGRICNGAFKCILGANCGGDEFETTEVAPNMLILLDRSGSMNERIDDDDACNAGNKRWNTAVAAIGAVMADRGDSIRFGLSTYPSSSRCGGVGPCAGNDCDNECFDYMNGCNVTNIPSGSSKDDNYEPGYVDRIVGSTPASINQFLASSGPGGRTPTARALRVIADNPMSYGLPVANDPVVRDNYILLVTDGSPNGATAGTSCASACNSGNGCNANCMVNLQLARLRTLAQPIKTFTVGFAFDSLNKNLNCNATFGGTLREVCEGIANESNCRDVNETCYYSANSPSQLATALADISQQISGCTFDMDQLPPDISQLYVFTRALEGGVVTPGTPYIPVPKQSENPSSYYTVNGLRIQLFGQVCDDVRAGLKKPAVIYGCPNPGG